MFFKKKKNFVTFLLFMTYLYEDVNSKNETGGCK